MTYLTPAQEKLFAQVATTWDGMPYDVALCPENTIALLNDLERLGLIETGTTLFMGLPSWKLTGAGIALRKELGMDGEARDSILEFLDLRREIKSY